MEDVKMQEGDFYYNENIDSNERQKMIITMVDYEKDVLRYRNVNNFDKEFSINISVISRVPFFRRFNILEVVDYEDVIYAKLSLIDNLQIGGLILDLQKLNIEYEFIIKKGFSTYHQIIQEIEKDSGEVTIMMNNFYVGFAVVNGRKFKGYIDA
jgi:hypothetical protein